jgi:hypothetical protein
MPTYIMIMTDGMSAVVDADDEHHVLSVYEEKYGALDKGRRVPSRVRIADRVIRKETKVDPTTGMYEL